MIDVKNLNPHVSDILSNMEFAMKVYFNYGQSRTNSLRRNHAKDLRLLFSLPHHPNILHGLVHLREMIDEDFFKLLPQKLSKEIPIARENLPYKVQAVLLPLLGSTLNDFIRTITTKEQNDIIMSKKMEKIILKYCLGIAKGINHLHSFGYGHCDIKLDNILINLPLKEMDQIDNFLKYSEPVIIDFGMSTKFGIPPSGGNALYSPPEDSFEFQNVTPKRDIFSLGCIFYVMISGGQHPFSEFTKNIWKWNKEISNPKYPLKKDIGKFQYTIDQILFGKESIPIEFQNLIKRMMHPKPEERPQMNEIIKHLEDLIQGFQNI